MQDRLDLSKVLRHVLRPRVLAYGALLALLASLLLGSLATRNPLKVDVIRDRHTLARIAEGGNIENTYRVHLMNASERPQRLAVAVQGIDGITISGPDRFDVDGASNRAVPLVVHVPPGAGTPGINPIRVVVRSLDDDRLTRDEKSTFIIPR
jgi:polyferredoxin